MAENGLIVHTPLRDNMVETRSKEEISTLLPMRRQVETVIGQMTEHFGVNKNIAHSKSAWLSQLYRKVLSYNLTKTGKY
jgi:hypothetical protein